MAKSKDFAISGKRAVAAPSDALCAITDVGLVRECNEDSVYVADDAGFLIVADGLGGLPAGDVASRAAVDATVLTLAEASRAAGGDDPERWEGLLRRAFDDAQKAVLAASRTAPGRAGMATTLVVAAVRARHLFVVHVGDVRAYRLGRKGLERLTNDHSVVGELVTAGLLDEEEGRVHPERNVVTQVLGAGEGFTADFNPSPLEAGDVVLLCSDGLWETMDAERLAEILGAKGTARSVAEALVAQALDAGGHDNISAVVYKHG